MASPPGWRLGHADRDVVLGCASLFGLILSGINVALEFLLVISDEVGGCLEHPGNLAVSGQDLGW